MFGAGVEGKTSIDSEGNDTLRGRNTTIPIVAHGGEGHDLLIAGFGDDILRGGTGHDILQGYYGHDVLLGGTGHDTLLVQGDRDLIIGGLAVDHLLGNSGDDLLIGGLTSYDSDLEAQDVLVTEWASGRTFNERIENLNGTGVAPPIDPYYLIAVGLDPTCFGDPDSDLLVGSRGDDWLIGDGFDVLRSAEELTWM